MVPKGGLILLYLRLFLIDNWARKYLHSSGKDYSNNNLCMNYTQSMNQLSADPLCVFIGDTIFNLIMKMDKSTIYGC